MYTENHGQCAGSMARLFVTRRENRCHSPEVLGVIGGQDGVGGPGNAVTRGDVWPEVAQKYSGVCCCTTTRLERSESQVVRGYIYYSLSSAFLLETMEWHALLISGLNNYRNGSRKSLLKMKECSRTSSREPWLNVLLQMTIFTDLFLRILVLPWTI